MAITIQTNEGTRISGDTALDVVSEMNARALIGESDAWRYMVVLASRVRQLSGATIRTTSPEMFLADLAAASYITLVQPAAPGEAGA